MHKLLREQLALLSLFSTRFCGFAFSIIPDFDTITFVELLYSTSNVGALSFMMEALIYSVWGVNLDFSNQKIC